MISLIVAYSRKRAIGKNGTLPWRIPGELKRFKQLTMGHAVIMGRKSYEDVGSPLPGRLNIVLSRTETFSGENLVSAKNLDEAIALAGDREIFIAGGGEIYAQAIDLCDTLYITEVEAGIDGDTFFPEFDESLFDKTVEKHVDGEIPYTYVTYRRKEMATASKKKDYRVIELNPQLKPFEGDIELRMQLYRNTKAALLPKGGRLYDFANAHHFYGFHRVEGGWLYREWAPSAHQLYLAGEFNNWNQTSHPMKRIENGNWELFLEGENTLWEGCKVGTIVDANLTRTQHVPLYARRVVQDKNTLMFTAEVVDEKPFAWTDAGFKGSDELFIYEAHVGMAQEEGRIGTYREFADLVLPRVKKAGYNTIQLMAIMEHPYYGSFGYQVSSFFAASSWFGKPEDLKYLVNTAHSMGIRVLLDVVHSHAVKNTAEGLNMFDGTEWQFFHSGPKGDHPAWGTKCFNYGKHEVIHFLLSNLKFWMEEYHFDGFRFDGITSMLYHDHGLGVDFDSDSKYFSYNTHVEAITYLQLANELIREVNPDAVTIAEDMSGMPGMCLPIADGGIGFDYRLGMGLPDMWIRTIKEKSDESWELGKMWGDMCLRRPGENTVAYVESHDQALVGDKTMIFRLADAAMYTDMNRDCHNPVIDRAIALHKLIRLFTMAGGGEGYLNFMGNEFGHPEWIDFPREGNGWSFHYCRRQWSLMDNDLLKYGWLGDFDREMISIAKEHKLFSQRMGSLKLLKEDAKFIAFERSGLLFAINFHPTNNCKNIRIPVSAKSACSLLLSSDDERFGGWNGINAKDLRTVSSKGESYLEISLPPRTAVVLETKA